MAATKEQKRLQQQAFRRAVQIIREEQAAVWDDAYARARYEQTGRPDGTHPQV